MEKFPSCADLMQVLETMCVAFPTSMTKPEFTQQFAQAIADTIKTFCDDHTNLVVKERGATLFSLSTVEYQVDVHHDRCSLYFWGEHLNMRRTVVKADHIKGCLRLTIVRFGSAKKEVLWLAPSNAVEVDSANAGARVRYSALVSEILEVSNPYPVCRSAIRRKSDTVLPHIKGPYVLGIGKWDTQRWAFIAVGSHEKYESIICVLRAGIAWLARRRAHSRFTIRGLKVICPRGYEEHLASRIAWLSANSTYELYSLDETEKELVRVSCERERSCHPDVLPAFDQQGVLKRSMGCVAKLLTLLPPRAAYRIELQPISFSIVSVRLDGLHFASIRYGPSEQSPRLVSRLYYRAGRKDILLEGSKSEQLFSSRMIALFNERAAKGARTSPYYRSGADAWLAKRIREVLVEIEPTIDKTCIYCNVASSSHGRSDSIDILAASTKGRLMIVHIRADAERVFPMHGLDQWIRFREMNRSGALKEAGYFPGITLSADNPCILFVAPALRLQPESEAVLRSFSESIEWKFIAISELWRTSTRVIYRKDAADRSTSEFSQGFASKSLWHQPRSVSSFSSSDGNANRWIPQRSHRERA